MIEALYQIVQAIQNHAGEDDFITVRINSRGAFVVRREGSWSHSEDRMTAEQFADYVKEHSK